MTLEKLQNDMTLSLKNGNKFRRMVLADLVASVQKASMAGKKRVDITEKLVDEVLLKAQKTVQEMIDTCPADRADKLTEYKTQMEIINEYAPTLITDEAEIRGLILDVVNNEMEFSKANRGKIMKIAAPVLKGKADMGVVSKVLGGMLK